ncbi:Hsp20 family protein [Marivibrio halodurans]|uniref:Hsp20 family protein n=1 Tax=Marivibrio halodurans TaxID=2039722 RepID=A0A8J7S6K2_9PROT|nr:Hsp20 family protein [Marivibrio halodurans]MBP5857709.1 Hsp20 family protein [Marivibrio halodurans]
MRTYDLSPLFRTSVGFDRLARMLDTVGQETAPSYPPYNIEKVSDDEYRITMAVAGFGEDDLDVTVERNTLTISGRISETVSEGNDGDQAERQFLHRGIAARAFERRFNLADHIKIDQASLENGLLHVTLKREVPEEAKPRQIAINGKSKAKAIEGKSSAESGKETA